MSKKHPAKETEYYETLCRDFMEHAPTNLHCHFYYTKMSPFTILAPFKIEELSLAPYIALYHDVIYDNEIAELKSIAAPRLEPALVAEDNEKWLEARIAKTTFLKDNETESTKLLNQRFMDMTAFNVTAAERLNILNYGLGGNYGPHYDALSIGNSEKMKTDDRRVTVLIYLSDVEQGGYTVFPKLDIVVEPRKGQALVWYNVDNNGDYNKDVLHAACPVLVGSKWVLTKWIHDYDQFQLGFAPMYLVPAVDKVT